MFRNRLVVTNRKFSCKKKMNFSKLKKKPQKENEFSKIMKFSAKELECLIKTTNDYVNKLIESGVKNVNNATKLPAITRRMALRGYNQDTQIYRYKYFDPLKKDFKINTSSNPTISKSTILSINKPSTGEQTTIKSNKRTQQLTIKKN